MEQLKLLIFKEIKFVLNVKELDLKMEKSNNVIIVKEEVKLCKTCKWE
jgi:hypothetical protein